MIFLHLLITFLFLISYSYSLFFCKSFFIKKIDTDDNNNNNNNNKVKFIQKIIFIKSNKQIDIYNYENSNNILIKYYNDNNLNNVTELKFKIDNNNKIILLDKKNNNFDYNFLNNLLNKNIIQIGPGGILGYYNMGICKIIKEKYNLDNYIFNGISAGSWNSLFMVYKNKNIDKIINNIFEVEFNNIFGYKKLQLALKKHFLQSFNTNDFNLDRLFISVSVLEKFKCKKYIYTDFNNLEDVLNCCIASSNIPFITGDLFYKYKNKISFDGALLKNYYLQIKNPKLRITNDLWYNHQISLVAFCKINNINKLYLEGMYETLNNINLLNKILYNK